MNSAPTSMRPGDRWIKEGMVEGFRSGDDECDEMVMLNYFYSVPDSILEV